MVFNRNQSSSILEALKASSRGMNVTEVAKATGLNRATVAKYLEMLFISGHVDMRTFGTSKLYYISQRMPISAFLNFSSDMIIILDQDSRVLNANDIFFEFTNTKREDVVHKNIGHFAFPLQFDPPIQPSILQAINGHGSTVESYYRKKDKGYYFNVKLIPLVFDGGENGVAIIFEDITEKKLAEMALRDANKSLERKVRERTQELEISNEALRKSESYLNEAQQIAHLGCWSFNLKTREVYASDETCDLFGIGRGHKWTYDLFTSRIHPDDISKVEASDKMAISERKPVNYEYRIILPDGSERIIHSMRDVRSGPGGDTVEIFGTIQDVTERRRIERELKESEARYRMLIEKSYDLIFNVKLDGTITYVSPQISHYGYTTEDVVNHNFFEFIPIEFREFLQEKFRETAINGERSPTEFMLRGKDGQKHWAEVTGKMIYDDARKPLYQVGTVRDISDRKRAEEALQDSEEQFRALADSSKIGILLVQNDDILYLNQALAEMSGYTVAECLEMKFWDLAPIGMKEHLRDRSILRQRGEPGPSWIEITLTNKNGEPLYLDCTATMLQYRGKPAMMLTAMDVTERKHVERELKISEEKYRNLIETVHVLIWAVDENNVYTYLSPMSVEALGYLPEELIGKTTLSHMAPDELNRVWGLIKPLLDERKPFELVGHHMIKKDGSKAFFKTNGMPIFDDNGMFKGYRGVSRDITNGRR